MAGWRSTIARRWPVCGRRSCWAAAGGELRSPTSTESVDVRSGRHGEGAARRSFFGTAGAFLRSGGTAPPATDGTRRALVMVMHESQQIAAEHHELAAHAHRSGAEHHGKEDRLTGHESSRQVLEHSNKAYLNAQKEHQTTRRTEHGSI